MKIKFLKIRFIIAFLFLSVYSFGQKQDRNVSIGNDNDFKNVAIHTGDIYNTVKTYIDKTAIIKGVEKANEKALKIIIDSLSNFTATIITHIEYLTYLYKENLVQKDSLLNERNDTIRILLSQMQSLQQDVNNSMAKVNEMKEVMSCKNTWLPFGIAQFKYGKTGKGTLLAVLQSATLLGGGIGAGIYFKKYNDYGEYAKIEQDDDKIKDYLQKQENNLWCGIGCLASIVTVYGVNVICNKTDRKYLLKVSAYYTPQSKGLSFAFNF